MDEPVGIRRQHALTPEGRHQPSHDVPPPNPGWESKAEEHLNVFAHTAGQGQAPPVGGGKLTRKGYRFDSWNTKPDGTGTKYLENRDITFGKESSSITLYAQWTASPTALPQTGGDDDMRVITLTVGGLLTAVTAIGGVTAIRRRRN